MTEDKTNKPKYGVGQNPNSLKNLKPVKPGEIRNPLGAGAQDPVKRAMKRFTQEFMREIIELAVMGNLAELKKIAENPATPAIQVGVATALVNAIQKGDWNTLESIVSRVIGKVPDKIEVNNGAEEAFKVEFVKAEKK